MKLILNIFLHLLIVLLLTIITQIGGVVYLLSLFISRTLTKRLKLKFLIGFSVLYLIITLLVIPFIAPFFGREKIIHTEIIHPTNYMTVLLNRNYVKPEMNLLLKGVEKELQGSDITINYLDANFPFINGFPLLPHRSHNDGKKLDISFIYEFKDGKISDKQRSFSGYGFFENPKNNEVNQINLCLEKGHFQYDFTKYFTFGTINKDLKFSNKGTKQLITAFLQQKDLGKLFIEPHLKQRLYLNDARVRYHGCKAVRHDDHIHIQLK